MLKPNQTKRQEGVIRWHLSKTLPTYSSDRTLPVGFHSTSKSRYCVDLVAQYPAIFSCVLAQDSPSSGILKKTD